MPAAQVGHESTPLRLPQILGWNWPRQAAPTIVRAGRRVNAADVSVTCRREAFRYTGPTAIGGGCTDHHVAATDPTDPRSFHHEHTIRSRHSASARGPKGFHPEQWHR